MVTTRLLAWTRLNGAVVGIIAHDCTHFTGAMTAEGSQKAKRVMELCNTFNIPVVNFLDEPGFMIGPDAKKAATIRYEMSAVAARRCNQHGNDPAGGARDHFHADGSDTP